MNPVKYEQTLEEMSDEERGMAILDLAKTAEKLQLEAKQKFMEHCVNVLSLQEASELWGYVLEGGVGAFGG